MGWIKSNLTNGILGFVRAMVYNNVSKPPDLPDYILVEFDIYNGSFIIEKFFPIVPIVWTWYENGKQFTRKQFPLSVTHAGTIHKAQGITLTKVAIDIGPIIQTQNPLPVALLGCRIF